MAKGFSELEDTSDPGWPAVQEWIRGAVRPVTVHPTTRERGEAAVVAIQASTQSALGAVALSCAGIEVDGWVRILGAGSESWRGSLVRWNRLGAAHGPRLPGAFIAAYDAIGGVFALDGGAFGGGQGHAFYLPPDTLEWESCDRGYSELLHFFFSGDLDGFYESLRPPSWREDLRGLAPDQARMIYPPGAELTGAGKVLPADELFEQELKFMQELAASG